MPDTATATLQLVLTATTAITHMTARLMDTMALIGSRVASLSALARGFTEDSMAGVGSTDADSTGADSMAVVALADVDSWATADSSAVADSLVAVTPVEDLPAAALVADSQPEVAVVSTAAEAFTAAVDTAKQRHARAITISLQIERRLAAIAASRFSFFQSGAPLNAKRVHPPVAETVSKTKGKRRRSVQLIPFHPFPSLGDGRPMPRSDPPQAILGLSIVINHPARSRKKPI